MIQRVEVSAVEGFVPANGNDAAALGEWGGVLANGKSGGASWRLCCGDSRTVLRKLPDYKFGCVVTSPPYFWQRDYGVEGQIGLERSISGYVNALAGTMDEVHRVLDQHGVMFLNLGDTYYSGKGRPKGVDPKHSGRRLDILRAVDASGLGVPQKTALGMPWRVALELVDRGWILRAPIVWRRENAIPEANVLDRPWRTYEMVFMFAKSRRYRFSRKPLENAGVEDVWTIESQARSGRKHPATFPAELVTRCIDLAHVKKKGWVLDPFAGSGTVMKVALDRGLNAFGIDLNRGFCQQIMKEISTQTPLTPRSARGASVASSSSNGAGSGRSAK